MWKDSVCKPREEIFIPIFDENSGKFSVILEQKRCKIVLILWVWIQNYLELAIIKKSQFLGKYSHTLDENFAKFSVILVIFRCQIHEEPIFRFQVQIKAGALFSIFPPILNFQKMVKITEFFTEKIWKSWHFIFGGNIIVSV